MSIALTLRALEPMNAPAGLENLPNKLSGALKNTEKYILGGVDAALDPNNALMRTIPKPVEDQMRRMESQITSPMERKRFEAMKANVNNLYGRQHSYVTKQLERTIQTKQIEISLKGVSKTMSGIQQLLSSQ